MKGKVDDMATPQEQYLESLRSGQQAVMQAMEAWTVSAQKAFGGPRTGATGAVDPDVVIDQVFDFAEQLLALQRRFAKSLAASAAEATASKK
jgi:hypothetical protein